MLDSAAAYPHTPPDIFLTPATLPLASLDESLLERSVSDQRLPTAGSVRVGTHKGMRGYVRPTAGSAEDAALKRTKSRGATGVVLKVTYPTSHRTSSRRGSNTDAESINLSKNNRETACHVESAHQARVRFD